MSKFVMDIETSGLNIYRDDVIELCVFQFDRNYMIEDTFYRLLKSRCRLPNHIIGMTGITDELITNRPYFSDVKKELFQFIRGNDIYTYSNFEYRFLGKRYGFKNKFIDVCSIVKRRFPDFLNYKLGTVLKRFKIIQLQPHRATGDSLVLSFLMRELGL